MFFHQDGLIKVLSHQVVFDQGGVSAGCFFHQDGLIKVLSHQVVFDQGGVSAGCFFIRIVRSGSLSSGGL